MDPRYSKQDIVRCTLCQTSAASMICEVCVTHLCKDCVDEHFSDSSKVHNVVPLKQHWATLKYPECRRHPNKQCELHCEQCDIPICLKCISSGEHSGHKQDEILHSFETKQECLQKDLQELETHIYPIYQKLATIFQEQKSELNKKSEIVTTALDKQGEIWHREIETIIKNMKSDLSEMKSKQMDVIHLKEDEIARTMSKIKENIEELKALLDSKDVCLVSGYKSRNAEFDILPPDFKVSLPKFTPHEINRNQLRKLFCSLSLTTDSEDFGDIVPIQGAGFPPQDRSLLYEPKIIKNISTTNEVLSVACLNETKFWTYGVNSNIMMLYNIEGELLKSIQTESKNVAYCIAVTCNGDLLYTDYHDRTVNMVKGTQIQTVIKLQGWKPDTLCCTSSGELLIAMNSDDETQTKIVRYSGFSQKQTIQYDDKGQPLYSCAGFISENRNLDICVSDYKARAVVVVDQAGKRRFIYTGSLETFHPFGVATDSQSRILISDRDDNDCIHILNQDGQFLSLIVNYQLNDPWGLCVDSKDYLFVAEGEKSNVKKIQYCT